MLMNANEQRACRITVARQKANMEHASRTGLSAVGHRKDSWAGELQLKTIRFQWESFIFPAESRNEPTVKSNICLFILADRNGNTFCVIIGRTHHTHKRSLHSFPVVSLSPRFKLVKSFGAMWLTSSLHWLVFHSASTFKLHSVAALFNTAFVDKSWSKVPHAEPWVLNLRTSKTNNADQNRVPYPLRARCYFIGTKKNINRVY